MRTEHRDTRDLGDIQSDARVVATYFHNGCFDRRDFLLSVLVPTLPFKLNRYRLDSVHEKKKSGGGCEQVEIRPYDGQNSHVFRMQRYISDKLSDDLVTACVHGSIGSGEEISYSDFDAIAVIKDEVFRNAKRTERVAKELYRSQTIMYDYDPLQHHGWFIIKESQLMDYPESYFPAVLWKYAGAIFPSGEIRLDISFKAGKAAGHPFQLLSDRLISQIEGSRYPRNLYQLKSFLSRFMLLPALYVEARDGIGIFKKFSFKLASTDFSSDLWSAMDEATRIRSLWAYKISKLRKWMMSKPNTLSRLMAKRFAPAIPSELAFLLNEDFYQKTRLLCLQMQSKIREKNLLQ